MKNSRAGGADQSGRIEVLHTQTQQLTRRARLIRLALIFFLTTIALLIVCSLTLAASWFAPAGAFLAALFFVLGLLSRLDGIIAAMRELRGALQPVELNAVDLLTAEGLQEAEALMTAEDSSDSSSEGSRP